MRAAGTVPVGLPPTHAEQVMGTVVSLSAAAAVAESRWRRVVASACAELHRVDEAFSPWKPGSVVSRLRRGELAEIEAPDDVVEVLALCRRARELSGGWFDPWALPGGVDPSGLVKGWAVERAARCLRAGGIAAAAVNGGGDVTLFGRPPGGGPWRIGIRHPWRANALAAVVESDGGAVATSGPYERGEHLFDPHTATPTVRAASATVTGPDLAIADALATALAVAGPGGLAMIEALDGHEAHLVGLDGAEHTTSGMRLVGPYQGERCYCD
jgi:thiamine biosynthesis lipoprotein